MSNKIAVCNSALVTLGAETITSFEDGSVQATACKVKYDIARRAVIRLHPWNFAVKRRNIAPRTEEPVFRYKYKFTLPSECLRLMKVYNVMDYKLEGRDIFTSTVEEPSNPYLEIKYIYDNESVSSWDPLFVDLMVSRMALELAYTIPQKNSMIESMYSLYAERLQTAKGIDAQEDIEDPIDQFEPDLIRVRL